MKFEPNKRTIGELYYEPRTNYEIPSTKDLIAGKKNSLRSFGS